MLAGKPEGNGKLWKPWHTWNNIKMGFEETGHMEVHGIYLTQYKDQYGICNINNNLAL
jgi:hypothetical protein